jgi:hypothetical protein
MSNTESPRRSIVDNEVMDEVYANREALSARFNYDVHELGDYLRERRKELEKQGVRFVNKEDVEKRQ